MDQLVQDVRYALRALRRSPGFALAAVLTLALGIGANTAIYSVVDAVLVRDLPYPDADQLVTIWSTRGQEGRLLAAIPDVEDFKARVHAIADIGSVRQQSVNLTGIERPDRLTGAYVTANVFSILGARAVVGRLFTPEETAHATGRDVVVLSYATWRARFGGDSGLVGKTLMLDGRPREVVGVAAEGFRDPFAPVDLWLSIGTMPDAWFQRGNMTVWAFARLKPGVSAEQGQREVSAVAAQLATEEPRLNAGVGAIVVPMRSQVVGTTQGVLLTILVFVGVVLLIACANVANLQLARSEGRRREMAVRAALGAARSRLARQLLSENLVLSAVGGGFGLVLAIWATRALVAAVPGGVPAFGAVGIDMRVVLFCGLLTVVTGLAFGAAPALRSSRADIKSALALRPGQSRGGRGVDVRDVLITAQLALCIVLLIGAGLLSRSLVAMQRVDTGFSVDNVVSAEFRLPAVKYRTPADINQFIDRATEAVRAVPGVQSMGWVRSVPLTGNFGRLAYVPVGEAMPQVPPIAQANSVSPGFFATLGIRLVEGRDFSAEDRANGPLVVVVSDELVRRTWPGQSALGKRLRLIGPPDTVATVVGVVNSIKQRTLSDPPSPQIYGPLNQSPGTYNCVAVRATGDPTAIGVALRAAIWSIDKDQPVWRIQPLAAGIRGQVAQPRFTLILTGAFALLALALACVGVYGVMSYVLAQRTREVGIRVALGASANQVVGAALGRGVRVVGVAVVVGTAAAFGAARLLQSQKLLFGVGPADPATFVVVPLMLAAVALVACYVPARRAARVDPMVSLRSD